MLAHKEYVGLHEVPGGALNINQVLSGVSRLSGRLFGIGIDFKTQCVPYTFFMIDSYNWFNQAQKNCAEV